MNRIFRRTFHVLGFILMSATVSDALALKSTQPHIMSVGLAAIDFVATVDHFPKPDEKIRSSSLLVEGGGNAANTACAMARLAPFAQCSLVTAVADDANGKTMLDGLSQNKVNLLVDQYEGTSPFSYIMTTDVDGSNTRTIIHQPSSGDMTVKFVRKLSLDSITAAHFDVRYPSAAMALAKRCVKENIPYSVDVERPREGLSELMRDATIVICNADYCDTILGENVDGESVSKRLRTVIKEHAPNAKIALQTMGGKGCCLILPSDESTPDDKEKVILQDENDSNSPVVVAKDGALFCSVFGGCQVVDTTGAGDAFIGGFLTAVWAHAAATEEIPLDDAILARALRVGSRVAAKKIEKPGARNGLPSGSDEFIQAEMQAMLGSFVDSKTN